MTKSTPIQFIHYTEKRHQLSSLLSIAKVLKQHSLFAVQCPLFQFTLQIQENPISSETNLENNTSCSSIQIRAVYFLLKLYFYKHIFPNFTNPSIQKLTHVGDIFQSFLHFHLHVTLTKHTSSIFFCEILFCVSFARFTFYSCYQNHNHHHHHFCRQKEFCLASCIQIGISCNFLLYEFYFNTYTLHYDLSFT